MGEKDEQTMGRLELADFLTNLGEQVRRGALSAHGRTWTVPEAIDVHLEFKEKKGRINAKLGWSWSTLGDYDQAAKAEVARWQGDLKLVKKRMGATFKELQRVVGQGAFPDERILRDLAESSRAFAAMADADWQEAMQEFLDHLANLQHAVANRQQEVMLHELRDLQNRMAACHREFKGKGGTAK
ncbi:MAG: GAK system XXXCH domain-containing protein [Desulfobaccales bacterium]